VTTKRRKRNKLGRENREITLHNKIFIVF